MHDYQKAFIEFALSQNALSFGEYTLKSGRISPYFYNSGLFNTGGALAKLAEFYAHAIIDSDVQFDMVFGPAYKGIPLVAAVSMSLAMHHNRDVPYAFNRKEAKDHGEGGNIVGHKLFGKVLIIDDVITAGTAVRESMTILNAHEVKPAGVVISLDRQERGQGETSAIQEVEQHYRIPVISIVKLEHIMNFVHDLPESKEHLTRLQAYREAYGV